MQKKILVLALFNAGGEVQRDDHFAYRAHVYTRELIVSLYKLEAKFVSSAEAWDPDPNATMRTDRPVRDRRGWVFERKRGTAGDDGRIEVDLYNTAITAVTRAFARLEKRGLVKRRRRTVHAGAGIVLTRAGYQEALTQLKAIDPDRYQLVLSLLQSKF